jgi:hypothetical protein
MPIRLSSTPKWPGALLAIAGVARRGNAVIRKRRRKAVESVHVPLQLHAPKWNPPKTLPLKTPPDHRGAVQGVCPPRGCSPDYCATYGCEALNVTPQTNPFNIVPSQHNNRVTFADVVETGKLVTGTTVKVMETTTAGVGVVVFGACWLFMMTACFSMVGHVVRGPR